MTSNASIRATPSSTSLKCTSASYLDLSPHYVADSNGRNLTSMTFLGRLDDTECCSAPSVGVRRMLQPRGSLFSWIALPRSINLKLHFRESGHARGQPRCRIKSGAADSRNGTGPATPPHDGYPLPD